MVNLIKTETGFDLFLPRRLFCIDYSVRVAKLTHSDITTINRFFVGCKTLNGPANLWLTLSRNSFTATVMKHDILTLSIYRNLFKGKFLICKFRNGYDIQLLIKNFEIGETNK